MRILYGAVAIAILGCVERNPFPEPPEDIYLELEKLLAFVQQAAWKQEEYGEDLKRFIERTVRYVDANRERLLADAIAGTAEVRPIAIQGLGFAGGGWSREALIKVLADPDPALRERAIQALALLQSRGKAKPEELPRRRIEEALSSTFSREVVQALFFFSTSTAYAEDDALLGRIEERLAHPAREARVQAARTLTIHRRERSVPALRRALTDSEPLVRINAVAGLAAILQSGALPQVIPLLADSHPDVVQFSAELLAHLAPRGILYRCAADGDTHDKPGPCGKCGAERIPVPRD